MGMCAVKRFCEVWIIFPACSAMADTTLGWQCPVDSTPMPVCKIPRGCLQSHAQCMAMSAYPQKTAREPLLHDVQVINRGLK